MWRKPTIALVNDNENTSANVRRILEGEDFNVRLYTTATHAFDLIDNPVDLALLDNQRSSIGTMELYKRIRARHAMPVVFLSAWAEDIEQELRATGLEADGYIQLPFSHRSLVAQVKKVLGR
jgi:two-component system, OmpR family, response regulator ChvI